MIKHIFECRINELIHNFKDTSMNKLQFYGLILFLFSYVTFAQSEKNRHFKEYQDIATYFKSLTKNSTWKLLDSIPLKFKTYHPQGMLKVGNYFYLSSVETIKPTEKYEYSIDGYDRSTGSGRGYLFKFNKKGKLISKVHIGEGTIFHPGGIDFDGQNIWVSVAEYRPNSISIYLQNKP